MTTKKKKPNENDYEISVCEVECQTHGDDTESVATLIESCETEPSCSASITFTNITNNVKNSELDENHPTLVQQDMRRFSSLKYEQIFTGYIIVVLNQDICVNIVNFFKKRFSNQCTQIRLYYRLFQMYANFFT